MKFADKVKVIKKGAIMEAKELGHNLNQWFCPNSKLTEFTGVCAWCGRAVEIKSEAPDIYAGGEALHIKCDEILV